MRTERDSHLLSTLCRRILATCAVHAVAISSLAGASEPHSRASANDTEPYFIVVAADPQLLMNQKDDANWRTTIEHVNRLQPDFLIVCGDLLNASNKASDWEQPQTMAKHNRLADMYLTAAQGLDKSIPLRNVAGNHDVSMQPTPEILKWYKGRFGPPWYSFEHRQSLFIVLESNLLRDEQLAPTEGAAQMSWLRETLQAAGEKQYQHITVYMHHPLCLNSIDEPDQYFNIPKRRRSELLARFEKAGVDAVFSGHLHKNAYVRHGEMELVTTSSCGAPLGKDPLGFRILKVYPDRLEHKYYGFAELPKKVILATPE
jgi:3',5'-cyclic AMP phosphodiesterase CpdA